MKRSLPKTTSSAPTIVSALMTALQIILIIGGYILNDLSRTKAGVNHHVVFRKRQYQQTILSESMMNLYTMLLLVLLIAMVFYILRKRQKSAVIAMSLLTLLTLLLLLSLNLSVIIALPAYAYLLLILVIIWSLQLIKTMMRLRRKI